MYIHTQIHKRTNIKHSKGTNRERDRDWIWKCAHTHTHTHTHTNTHTHIHTFMLLYERWSWPRDAGKNWSKSEMPSSKSGPKRLLLSKLLYKHTHTYTHTYIHKHTHTNTHTYTHAYTHIHTHTHTDTHIHIRAQKPSTHPRVGHVQSSQTRHVHEWWYGASQGVESKISVCMWVCVCRLCVCVYS